MRVPMPAGTIIPIAGTDIRIARDGENEEYSAGSSCLVYRGHIVSGTGVVPGMQVIIKEFYPMSEDLSIDDRLRDNRRSRRHTDGSLVFLQSMKNSDTYKVFDEQFRQALVYQTALAGSNAMEVSVRPLFVSSWGDSSYVISDAHRGIPVEQASRDLRDRLAISVSFAEAMGILHENGYIMTDIKPDNFLWIQKPNSVRIIDTDSLIPFHDQDRLANQPIYTNKNHWSPELKFLDKKIRDGISSHELTAFRQTLLNSNADRYAMGVFLFELLFRRLPETSGRDACFTSDHTGLSGQIIPSDQVDEAFLPLLREFKALYEKEIKHAGRHTAEILQPILRLLQRLLIKDSFVRRESGYSDDNALVSDLQTIYAHFTNEQLVLRRETAKANARFAAYNLLQKYPLFDYPAESETQEKSLSVGIIGTHAMRPDMLAAVLSIGQMPGMPLHVRLTSPDAEYFWEDYISEKNNPGLVRAVTVEHINRRSAAGSGTNTDIAGSATGFDPGLVDRPLAHISINTQDGPPAQDAPLVPSGPSVEDGTLVENTLQSDPAPSSRRTLSLDVALLQTSAENVPAPAYYILLEENPRKRNAWIRHLAHLPSLSQQKILIAYLAFENAANRNYAGTVPDNVTLFAISTESFTEEYSEKMFSEKIYRMGLMAHAYYSKSMSNEDSGTSVDMKKLEKEFRRDLYNIASSERCALHGICKLASLGIGRDSPGRFLRYYRKIQDPEVLEKLAWSEHLSWTAFMLTSGAIPVSMNEFNEYAYQDLNDWKDKRNSTHLRHPLLAASSLRASHTLQGIERTEDVTPEIYGRLDPLDRVSVRIARWYAAKRDTYRDYYLEWLTRLKETLSTKSKGGNRQKAQTLIKDLMASGLTCIQLMGQSLRPQDPQFRRAWEETADRISALYQDRDDVQDLLNTGRKSIMKPVFDALEDRDFKQYDRDLAYAVIDIIA